jgi:hypothetical protein
VIRNEVRENRLSDVFARIVKYIANTIHYLPEFCKILEFLGSTTYRVLDALRVGTGAFEMG